MKILEISKEVECVEKGKTLVRIISFRGTHGKLYQYLIHNRSSSSNQQQDCLVPFLNHQLKQTMNINFASNKETAIRHLKHKGFGEYFVNWEVSLVEHKPKLKCMSDLLDEFLVAEDLGTDYALELYLRENTFGKEEAKQEIFRKMDKIIPNDLLRKFVLKSVKNFDEYFLFRNNFIKSYGMENFFSYLISNGESFFCVTFE